MLRRSEAGSEEAPFGQGHKSDASQQLQGNTVDHFQGTSSSGATRGVMCSSSRAMRGVMVSTSALLACHQC